MCSGKEQGGRVSETGCRRPASAGAPHRAEQQAECGGRGSAARQAFEAGGQGLLILSLTLARLEKGVRARKVCGAVGSSLAEKGNFSPLPL